MSVIGQPELLGRTARRRLVGVTAPVFAAVLEGVTVWTWFSLVALHARTLATALVGLGVLLCGGLLRTALFGAATGDRHAPVRPLRIGVATVLTAGWICWLLVAETIGGAIGIGVAAFVLTGVLVVQLTLERQLFRVRRCADEPIASVVPAALLVVGASALLASAWFSDWAVVAPLSFEATSLTVRFEAAHLGVVIFGLFAFLAHQRRFQRLIDP